MNHYQTLGVNRNAPKADIRLAYRNLVKKYHPDLNGTEEAKDKIRLINEAYEVLSEVYSRNLYDLLLDGHNVPTQPKRETEEEKYKREYLRKRSHRERLKIDHLVKVKSRFYKVERSFCFFFFFIGCIFTTDYYLFSTEEEVVTQDIKRTTTHTSINVDDQFFFVERSFYDQVRNLRSIELVVSYSSVFKIPARIRVKGSDRYFKTLRNLHSFNNVFSIIILVFSAVVIKYKEYSDFRLTAGLVPGFCILFLMLYLMEKGLL